MVLSPSYLTCADLDLENVSCVEDPTTHRTFNIHESPLNARAVMVQNRLERFKSEFDRFMTKSLVSLGKFNRSFRLVEEDDVVMILDKKKQTLPVQCKARYVLGVVEKKISGKSFKIRYINNSRTERCDRSLEGISLLVKADEARKATSCDVVIDPLFPAGPLVDHIKDIGGSCQEEEAIQGNDEGVPDDLEEVEPEPESEQELENVSGTGQEVLPTDQEEDRGIDEIPLPSKKPVVVQFVKKGKEVIKNIDRKKKQGKKM